MGAINTHKHVSCTLVYICTSTYAYLCVCTCTCTSTHTVQSFTHVCIHVRVYTYTCIYTYVYICINICTCVCKNNDHDDGDDDHDVIPNSVSGCSSEAGNVRGHLQTAAVQDFTLEGLGTGLKGQGFRGLRLRGLGVQWFRGWGSGESLWGHACTNKATHCPKTSYNTPKGAPIHCRLEQGEVTTHWCLQSLTG